MKRQRGLTIVEMAIVLFLMSLLLGIIFSMVQSFSIFKTTQGEAEILKNMYGFAKRTAMKSGQIIYMHFNLDENSYKIYRKIRTKEKIEEQVLSERKLFFTNHIVYIQTSSGKRLDMGTTTILFYPQSFNDEIYIYMGDDSQIKNTIIFPRYGRNAIVKSGEFHIEENLENILEEDQGENF